MSRPPATCHPNRKHCARGLCRPCYNVRWTRARKAREWKAMARPCELCGREYVPRRAKSLYCEPLCQVIASEIQRAERRGSVGERYATRDRDFVRALLATARSRGCRLARSKGCGNRAGAWVTVSHRGGGLYLIGVRWPEDEEREEAA